MKFLMLTLLISLPLFAQEKECENVQVVSDAMSGVSSETKNGKEHVKSSLKMSTKVTGCGCESNQVVIEESDSKARIAEKLTIAFESSCKGVTVSQLDRHLTKKAGWFRKLFKKGDKHKKQEILEIKVGKTKLKSKNGRKNKAYRKFSKCSKNIQKYISQIEGYGASEADLALIAPYKSEFAKYSKVDELGQETGEKGLDLMIKENLHSFDFERGKCNDKPLKKLAKSLKKANKKKS
jgi:hypothetical protein